MVWSPPSPDDEPYKVHIHKGEFIDAARNGRAVPYKVYYPSGDDLPKMPVVIWSHGLGGSRDGAAFLTRYLATQGYVIVNIQHVGTDSSIWEGKPGHPWDVIRAAHIPREASLDRFNDVPFVLDCLPQLATDKPEIGAIMDLDTIGMSGHSFGAMTTQVMAGQPFPDLDDNLTVIDEPRFTAAIMYSFVPMSHLTDAPPEDIYGKMRIPSFFMTGTDDDNPITGQGYDYRMPVYETAGCSEKSLLVLQDGDHMVFAGSRGKLGDNPHRDAQEEIIKATSLAFWDAYLKKSPQAKEWLTGNGVKSYLGTQARYEFSSQA